MPYKDKDKDREWHRDHMKRKRHGVTSGVTVGVTHTERLADDVLDGIRRGVAAVKEGRVKPLQEVKMGFESKPAYQVDAEGSPIYE